MREDKKRTKKCPLYTTLGRALNLVCSVQTILSTATLAEVRHNSFKYFFDILKNFGDLEGCNAAFVKVVVDCILKGFYDVWSTIRKTCRNKLIESIAHFGVEHVKMLYFEFLDTISGKAVDNENISASGPTKTQSSNNIWKQKEGATMGTCEMVEIDAVNLKAHCLFACDIMFFRYFGNFKRHSSKRQKRRIAYRYNV